MSKPNQNLASKPLEQIIRWPTPRSKMWVASFLNSAHDDDNIVAVVAVGSAVRPAVTSADLDLVVICRDTVKLKAKPPIEVDFRAYAAAKVDALISDGNDMLGWTVKFGHVLFQRQGYWDAIIESWRDRLPLPTVDVATRRAENAFRRLSNVFELGDSDAAHEQALSYVTHLARAELLKKQVYPASRPELPGQLRAAGCYQIAAWLEHLIDPTADHSKEIAELLDSRRIPSNRCARRRSVRRKKPIRNENGRPLRVSRLPLCLFLLTLFIVEFV